VVTVDKKISHNFNCNLNRFKKKFTERFLGKFAVKWIALLLRSILQ